MVICVCVVRKKSEVRSRAEEGALLDLCTFLIGPQFDSLNSSGSEVTTEPENKTCTILRNTAF